MSLHLASQTIKIVNRPQGSGISLEVLCFEKERDGSWCQLEGALVSLGKETAHNSDNSSDHLERETAAQTMAAQ